MPQTWQIALAAIGVLLALGLIVSMTLAHYIGGFFRTVEREAREEAEEEKAAREPADAGKRQER